MSKARVLRQVTPKELRAQYKELDELQKRYSHKCKLPGFFSRHWNRLATGTIVACELCGRQYRLTYIYGNVWMVYP